VEVQSVISAPQNLRDQKNEMYERNAFMNMINWYLLMGITQLQESGELLLFLEISYFDFSTIDIQSVVECRETPQNFFLYALMAKNSSIDSFDNSHFAQIAEKMFDTVRTINDSRIVDGCILLRLFYSSKDVIKWTKWTFEAIRLKNGPLKARKESEDCSPPSKKKKTSVEGNIPKNSEGGYVEEFPFLEKFFQNKELPQTPAQIQTYSNQFPIQTQPSSISSNFSLSPQQTSEDRNSDTIWEPSMFEEVWEPSPFEDVWEPSPFEEVWEPSPFEEV